MTDRNSITNRPCALRGGRLVLAARLAVLIALLTTLFLGGCDHTPDFDDQVERTVRQFRFSIGRWELENLPEIAALEEQPPATPQDVMRYFALISTAASLESQAQAINAGAANGDLAQLTARLKEALDEKNALEPAVQATLTAQIKETLISQGIYSLFGKRKLNLPPVNFKLDMPPHVLAISPRDRIYLQETVTLQQDITAAQMEAIESQVDALGVSSLVLDLGGFGGTYPTFVDNTSDITFTVETAIHEWLHQYLAFKPLGFRYILDLLGIRPDADIAAMNETLADMVSKELASVLLCHYYSQCDASKPQPPLDAFNFDQEMKNARKTVDAYLGQGDVSGAERFMEQEREYLLTKGYYIRKLNQAYFAFNDQYADTPASTNPIGSELQKLRSESASLRDFLDRVSRMTGRPDLTASIK